MISVGSRLSPMTPIFDPPKQRGARLVGDTPTGVVVLTRLLYDQITATSPYDFWTYRNATGTLVSEGSNANNATRSSNPTVFMTGADGYSYGEMGTIGFGPAQLTSTTAAEDYGDVYTTGMTMFMASYTTSTGSFWRKNKPGTSNADRLFQTNTSTNMLASSTRSGSNLIAKHRAALDASIAQGEWSTIEVYWPPGDDYSSIWINGLDRNGGTTNFAAVGNNGDGHIVVGTGGKHHVALMAIWMRPLTTQERTDLTNSATYEGWI